MSRIRVVVHIDGYVAWICAVISHHHTTAQSYAWFWKEQTFTTPVLTLTRASVDKNAAIIRVSTPDHRVLWSGTAQPRYLDQDDAGLVMSPGGLPGAAYLVGALPALFEHVQGPWTVVSGNSIGAVATAFVAAQPPGQEVHGAVAMATALLKMPSSVMIEPAPPIETGVPFRAAVFLDQQWRGWTSLYGRDVSWGAVAVTRLGIVQHPLECYSVFRPAEMPRSEWSTSVLASCTISSLMYSPALPIPSTNDIQEWIDGGYVDMLPLRNMGQLPSRLYVLASNSALNPDPTILPPVQAIWDVTWQRYAKQVAFLEKYAGMTITTVQPTGPIVGTTKSRNPLAIAGNTLLGRHAVLTTLGITTPNPS